MVNRSCSRHDAHDWVTEELFAPRVDLAGDGFRRLQEHRVARDRQFQIALVVQRHRRQLTERVFAVEHPAVRAGQERVGDVADALRNRGAGLGPGAGALDPLPPQIDGNFRSRETAAARLLHRVTGARHQIVRMEKRDPLVMRRTAGAAVQPRCHHALARVIDRAQRVERGEYFR